MYPDVVVIGGGIIGSCCAYYLADAGVRVHLVERGPISAGASGSCQFGIGHVNEGICRQLTMASNRLYREAAPVLPIDIELNTQGNVFIAVTPDKMANLEHTAQLLQGSGMRNELLDRRQLLELEPNVTPETLGGLFFPDDATVQSILATMGFALGARAKGAVVRPFTEVTGIEVTHGAVTAVQTTQDRIPTHAVVDAAGAWSAAVGKMAGVNVPIVPRKGHIVVTETAPHLVNTYLLDASYFDAVANDAAKLAVAMVIGQTRSGNLLLGSSRQFVGYDRQVDASVVREIILCCRRFFPSLDYLHAIRMYAGLRPSSPDLTPIIDKAAGVNGFYVATGHEGEGITMGPVTGKLISQLVTGQTPEICLDDVRLSRFWSN
jgi:D-hydroxyproline dehydrogenase subunit beta